MRCFGLFAVVFISGCCYAYGVPKNQGDERVELSARDTPAQQPQPQTQPSGPPQSPNGMDFNSIVKFFASLISPPQPSVLAPSVANQAPAQQQPNPQQPNPQQPNSQQPIPQQPFPQPQPTQPAPSFLTSLFQFLFPQPAQQVQPAQQPAPSIWSIFTPQQPAQQIPTGNFLARILGAVSSGFLQPGSTLYETLNSLTSGVPKAVSGVAGQPSGLMSILQSLPIIG